MHAWSEFLRRDGHLGGAEAATGDLPAGISEPSTDFARHATDFVRLTLDASHDPIGLARATAALRMYRAVQALERLRDALARQGSGPDPSAPAAGRVRHPSSIHQPRADLDPAAGLQEL